MSADHAKVVVVVGYRAAQHIGLGLHRVLVHKPLTICLIKKNASFSPAHCSSEIELRLGTLGNHRIHDSHQVTVPFGLGQMSHEQYLARDIGCHIGIVVLIRVNGLIQPFNSVCGQKLVKLVSKAIRLNYGGRYPPTGFSDEPLGQRPKSREIEF